MKLTIVISPIKLLIHMLLKYIEKKQIIGLHRHLKDTKETVSKQISIVLRGFPLTSKKRLS